MRKTFWWSLVIITQHIRTVICPLWEHFEARMRARWENNYDRRRDSLLNPSSTVSSENRIQKYSFICFSQDCLNLHQYHSRECQWHQSSDWHAAVKISEWYQRWVIALDWDHKEQSLQLIFIFITFESSDTSFNSEYTELWSGFFSQCEQWESSQHRFDASLRCWTCSERWCWM